MLFMFNAGQLCYSPTPVGGATPPSSVVATGKATGGNLARTSRYDLELSSFTPLSRQAETTDSQTGVNFQDAKLVCQVSKIKISIQARNI